MKKKITEVPKKKVITRTDVVAIRVTAKERKKLGRIAKMEDKTVSTMIYNWMQEKLIHETA